VRILYLIHTIDNKGGTEFHTKTLAKEISQFCDVSIVGLTRSGVALVKGNERTDIPSELPSTPKTPYNFQPLERILRDVIDFVKPHIIHVQHFLGWHYGVLDQLLATKLPSFLTLHDYFIYSPAFTYLASSFDEYLKNSHLIFGSEEREYLAERFKKLSTSIQRFKQVIVPSTFCERVFAKIRYPQVIEHGITPFEVKTKGKNIGFVGSFLPHKGAEVILKLGAKRDPLAPPIKVYGADGEAPGLKFEGTYDQEDRSNVFGDLKAVVIPSQFHETYCLVLSEALHAGVFPIVSDMGALGERVKQSGLGIVCRNLEEFEVALSNIDENFKPQKVRLATEMATEYLSLYG
jgi:glycosyltransferase involved in cell wall biosynthesis